MRLLEGWGLGTRRTSPQPVILGILGSTFLKIHLEVNIDQILEEGELETSNVDVDFHGELPR